MPEFGGILVHFDGYVHLQSHTHLYKIDLESMLTDTMIDLPCPDLSIVYNELAASRAGERTPNSLSFASGDETLILIAGKAIEIIAHQLRLSRE